jgi:peptidyl-prolyl cis-trans isomerase SurA
MFKPKAFLTVLIPLWLLLGAAALYGELADRIVAIVNEDAITLSELNEALEPYARQIRASVYEPEEERKMLFSIRQDVLNRMIDDKLTNQETERLRVSVDERDVDQQIEQIKSEHFFTEEELKKALGAEGYTLEQYRKRIKEQLLRVKLINIEVKSRIAITEKEIRDYYEEHKKAYQGKKKYHLRTILIRVPSSAAAYERADAMKRIEAVEEKFNSGAAFDELAKQYSEDVTAKDGGDLGMFFLEELSPQFQETVRSMNEGQVSRVLQTPQGYQVMMLQEIRNSPGKTLKEATIEIQERLYREVVEEKYKAWLMALRHRSYIKIIQ